jgi:hypothetical protein
MALRKNIEAEGVVVVKTQLGDIEKGTQKITFSAYIKVEAITGNKTEIYATVNFSGDTFEFKKQYEIPVSVETNAPNFIAQAYAHLKALPEFAGVVDC